MQPQSDKDLGPDPVISKIRLETQGEVGFDRILAFILQLVRAELVHQPDPTSFLVQIQQYTFASLLDDLHGLVQLLPAIASE